MHRYIPDKLLAWEVAYQMTEAGIKVTLQTGNKRSWPIFLIKIWKFTLKNVPHAKKQVIALKEIILGTRKTKGHNPKKVMYNHYKTLKMVPSFQREDK